MAQVILYSEHTRYLEINFQECEALLSIVLYEIDHLQKRISLDDILEAENELSVKRMKEHDRRKKRCKYLIDVKNALLELGNHLEP